MTCEFSAMALGIFAKALKNGVDARLKHAKKERRDGVSKQKNDKAGKRLELLGVCEDVSASVENEERDERGSECNEQLSNKHDSTRHTRKHGDVHSVASNQAETRCG